MVVAMLLQQKVEREVFVRRLSASVDTMEERIDKFKYEDFKKEIIQDFKEINVPKTKGYTYWLKIYVFIILWMFTRICYRIISYNTRRTRRNINSCFVDTFQCLTIKRLNQKVLSSDNSLDSADMPIIKCNHEKDNVAFTFDNIFLLL